jgi:hypothetical protein
VFAALIIAGIAGSNDDEDFSRNRALYIPPADVQRDQNSARSSGCCDETLAVLIALQAEMSAMNAQLTDINSWAFAVGNLSSALGGTVPWEETRKVLYDAGCTGITGVFQGMVCGDLDLSGIDLTGGHLGNVRFKGSNLSGATLVGANFAGEDNSWKHLDVNFTGANLAGANFAGNYAFCTNFTGANLVGANFAGYSVVKPETTCNDGAPKVDFTGANLTGVVGLDIG